MNRLILIPALALSMLSSCDHIDAVGHKVDELKDVREESTQGVDGMDLKAIVSGIRNTGPTVQDIGEVDFQTFISQSGRLNVVDFHADWCGPCKQLGPVLSGVIEENSGVARLGKLNVDQARQLSKEQGVSSIPDVRFYIDGKLVHKFTGAAPKETIESLIATHSANIDPSPAIAENDDAAATVPSRPRTANAKPIKEAVKPMEKDWLPPGMKRK